MRDEAAQGPPRQLSASGEPPPIRKLLSKPTATRAQLRLAVHSQA